MVIRKNYEDWQAEKISNYGRDPIANLIEELEGFELRADYTIKFVDFWSKEIERISYELQKHPEYRDGSLETVGGMKTVGELWHDRSQQSFRYRTAMGKTDLITNLREAMGAVRAAADIPHNSDGFTIVLYRNGLPRILLYGTVLTALVLLAIIIIVWATYRRHERNLTYIYNNANASQGADYLNKTAKILPHRKQWDEWAEQWNIHITEAEQHVQRAQFAVNEHDYDRARAEIDKAIALNSDNKEALALRDSIPDWEKGYQLFKIAETELENEPSNAAKRCNEAEDLNPALTQRINELRDRADQIFREGDLAGNIQRASQQIERKRPYHAITAVDEALHSISDLPGYAAEIDQLNSMRKAAAALIVMLVGDVEGTDGDFKDVSLLVADDIKLGRQSSTGAGDIMLGYRRLSRLGRQTRVYRAGDGYVVQDQESTNGTMIEGRELGAGESANITKPTKLAMGGNTESGDSPGSCQLLLTPANHSRNSLVIEFDQSSLKLLDRFALTEAWPTLEQDAAKKWGLVGESIAVGVHEGKFDVGCLQTGEPVLILVHDKQWFITPGQKSPESRVTVDGTTLMATAPLAPNVRVEVEGLWFKLQESTL